MPREMQVKNKSSFVEKYLYINPMLIPALRAIVFIFAFS